MRSQFSLVAPPFLRTYPTTQVPIRNVFVLVAVPLRERVKRLEGVIRVKSSMERSSRGSRVVKHLWSFRGESLDSRTCIAE